MKEIKATTCPNKDEEEKIYIIQSIIILLKIEPVYYN